MKLKKKTEITFTVRPNLKVESKHQAIKFPANKAKEAALGKIPIFACHVVKYVDIGVPANSKGKHIIGYLF